MPWPSPSSRRGPEPPPSSAGCWPPCHEPDRRKAGCRRPAVPGGDVVTRAGGAVDVGRRVGRRVGVARDEALASPVHDTRTISILGIALGVSFTTCFLTGLLSHLIQLPPTWFLYPARPAGLYRFTQGLHVATGIAAVPLLLAKLWA